ncbi:MAG TPA: hypothetical protein VGO48_04145 [Conexibacter sp.]|jgi:hypothetical protein|nr:hypothetical protein [Conexibacter sp.]
MRIIKLIAAACGAALILCAAAGSAAAGRFSFSNRDIRATWTDFKIESGPGELRCPLTMEGSFHSSTIAKVRASLIGYITRVSYQGAQPPCFGGQMTVLQETLPWRIQYERFAGTLPNITRIDISIIGASLRASLNLLGATCLGRSTAESPVRAELDVVAGRVTNIRLNNENAGIPLTGGLACTISPGHVAGNGRPTTGIVVTLI